MLLTKLHDFLFGFRDDVDLECSCGNPDCKTHLQVRRGYVHIRHEDGSTEERWDHCWINAIGPCTRCDEWTLGELLLTPQQARELMWQLVRDFMPGVSWLATTWDRYISRTYWRIRFRLFDK